MSGNSVQRLSDRLQARLKADTDKIEGLTSKELQRLQNSLRAQLKDVQDTIEADIASMNQSRNKLVKRRILWPVLTGLAVLIGISGGIWGLMLYDQSLIEDIQKHRQAMEYLKKAQIWGQVSTCGEDGKWCIQIEPGSVRYGEDGLNYRIIRGQ